MTKSALFPVCADKPTKHNVHNCIEHAISAVRRFSKLQSPTPYISTIYDIMVFNLHFIYQTPLVLFEALLKHFLFSYLIPFLSAPTNFYALACQLMYLHKVL